MGKEGGGDGRSIAQRRERVNARNRPLSSGTNRYSPKERGLPGGSRQTALAPWHHGLTACKLPPGGDPWDDVDCPRKNRCAVEELKLRILR